MKMSAHVARKWILLGISGVTCGGKSTLAKQLHKHLAGSIYINQDAYFREEDDPNHIIIPELNHQNWEALVSINWDSMLAKINGILSSEPVKTEKNYVIVDGHLIFNYEPLVKLFHKKYFITLTKEQCWERRSVRVYKPADPPGYFEKCIWPMYVKNKEEMERNVKDIYYLDGTRNPESIFQEVLKDIENSSL